MSTTGGGAPLDVIRAMQVPICPPESTQSALATPAPAAPPAMVPIAIKPTATARCRPRDPTLDVLIPATLGRMKRSAVSSRLLQTTQVAGVLAAAVVAAVVVAGCGSGEPGESDASGQEAGSSSTRRSSAPSTAVGPTHFDGVIEKKTGEPAGLNCSEEFDGPCDLNFNVTAIQPGASCGATDDRPASDEQFLRFDIDAFSSDDTFGYPDSADALLLTNWSVDGPDGTVRDLVSYPECGSGQAPVGAPVAAGPHTHARVVVRAPKPATTLRFSWLSLMWEWPIPGAD